MDRVKLAIVDDSRIFRSITEECFQAISNVEIVASLWSGDKLLAFIEANHVDLITLDVEMPGLDGLETLRKVQEYNERNNKNIGVIMLSSLTRKGGDATMQALELGAFDFIPKPDAQTPEAQKVLTKELQEKVDCWTKNKSIRSNQSGQAPKQSKREGVKSKPGLDNEVGQFDMICIGVSTGGPKALTQMIPHLCKVISCPVMIVQHMPSGFTESLASGLNNRCSNYEVCEAKDGEVIKPQKVYIAPGGEHMVVRTQSEQCKVGIHRQPPENGCRPSVDILFRSIALEMKGKRILSLILTGMGNDGTAGIRVLKRMGASIIVQDEKSSVVYGMPKCAYDTGLVDEKVPLMKIPEVVREMQG